MVKTLVSKKLTALTLAVYFASFSAEAGVPCVIRKGEVPGTCHLCPNERIVFKSCYDQTSKCTLQKSAVRVEEQACESGPAHPQSQHDKKSKFRQEAMLQNPESLCTSLPPCPEKEPVPED